MPPHLLPNRPYDEVSCCAWSLVSDAQLVRPETSRGICEEVPPGTRGRVEPLMCKSLFRLNSMKPAIRKRFPTRFWPPLRRTQRPLHSWPRIQSASLHKVPTLPSILITLFALLLFSPFLRARARRICLLHPQGSAFCSVRLVRILAKSVVVQAHRSAQSPR